MTRKKNAAAQALGRLGGAAGTPAQNAARKQNAQLAGRPKRVCTTCGEPVIGGHVERRLDDTCGAHGWRWQQRNAGPSEQPAPDLLRAVLETLENAVADGYDGLTLKVERGALRPLLKRLRAVVR